MTATRGEQIPNTQLVTAESLKYICTMILIQPDGNAAAFLTCCMAAASSMTFTKNVEGEERVLRAKIHPKSSLQWTKATQRCCKTAS